MLNRAAAQFGVPKTTLKDRMSGKVELGSKIGPAPYLNTTEEEELFELLIHMAKIGYGNTKRDLITIVKLAPTPGHFCGRKVDCLHMRQIFRIFSLKHTVYFARLAPPFAPLETKFNTEAAAIP